MRFPPSRTASALTSPASGHAWAAWVDAFAEASPRSGWTRSTSSTSSPTAVRSDVLRDGFVIQEVREIVSGVVHQIESINDF